MLKRLSALLARQRRKASQEIAHLSEQLRHDLGLMSELRHLQRRQFGLKPGKR